jgi:hypothetical protein
MGGRGRRAFRKHIQLHPDLTHTVIVTAQTERPYEMPLMPDLDLPKAGYLIVASAWDGAKTPFYPLFPQDRAWVLVAREGRTLDEHPVESGHRLGMDEPTLVWQNGTQRIELYVDGMTHEDFTRRYGIAFDVTKNGFVTSKRMSRTLRDYRIYGRFDEASVSVDYMPLDDVGEELWDGAGLVSRGMLERLHISPHLTPQAQERLREELAHIGRVEITLINSAGQHKAHAIVVDDMDVDFRLPNDIKRDAKTVDGSAFVGINAVHSKDTMRLDVQSIMNLHPFIESQQMLGYLEQEGALMRDAIESGRKAEAMARLERATLDDLEAWHLRDFFARGGDANWFPGMVKSLINGHIQTMELSLERGKLRVPFSGGRYYVMTEAVARQAGRDVQIERGHIELDPTTGTAWVNDDDWLQMRDSQSMGIKHILGGADQDDALWLHGFTDHDGARKVLAWRSPNNTGEYVILEPTANSQPMLWHTPEGETVAYPPADSRKLIPRIDHLEGRTQYLNLAQDPVPGELGQGQAYHPDIMREVNARTLENAGILGGYCNFTMAYKGTMGDVPPVLPDTLERVIDNDVKLGGSNAQVGEAIEQMTRAFIAKGTPVPEFLLPRFGVYPQADGSYPPNITTTQGEHWVDDLAQGVRAYTDRMTAFRDDKMAQARLPAHVHDSVAGDGDALQAGARFNAIYTQALRQAKRQYAHVVTAHRHKEARLHQAQEKDYHQRVMDFVRATSEAYLNEFPQERQTAILRGAMVSREMNTHDPKRTSSDSAFWQRGRIAQTSLQALRELDLLGEIHEEVTPNGTRLIRYPTTAQAEATRHYLPVKMNQVWFNRLRASSDDADLRPQSVPADQQKQHKASVRFLAQRSSEQGGFLGKRLRIAERHFGRSATARLVFEDEAGNVFGTIPTKEEGAWVVGENVIIRQAKGSDGNLTAMVEVMG